MLHSPAFLLGSSFATLYAGLFHLIVGRSLRQVFLYWVISMIGFMAGQALAELAYSGLPMLGQLHLIPATLTAWVALGIARLLKL